MVLVNMRELKKKADAMPEKEPTDEEDRCPYEGTEMCEYCKYFMDPCWGGLFEDEEDED